MCVYIYTHVCTYLSKYWFYFLIFTYVCMYTCLLVYIHTTCVGVCGGQKWVWKLLELELHEAASHLVWVLGTELVSSGGEQQGLLTAEPSQQPLRCGNSDYLRLKIVSWGADWRGYLPTLLPLENQLVSGIPVIPRLFDVTPETLVPTNRDLGSTSFLVCLP